MKGSSTNRTAWRLATAKVTSSSPAASPTVVSFINRSATIGGSPYPVTTTPLRDIYDATRGEQKVWSEGLGLTLVYHVNDYLTVKSITGLRAYERHDPSAYGPAVLIGNGLSLTQQSLGVLTWDGLYSLQDRGQGVRARSQELQFLGSAGDFDYVGGFYYYAEDAWDRVIEFFNKHLRKGRPAAA